MVLPMVGGQYLGQLWRGTTGKLRLLAQPLLKDGIGDRMDKGNLWVVPGFTLLVFAILWTTKLSKIALEESTCRGASIYDFGGTQLDDDAKRHCQTAKRYYVGPDESFSHDLNWRRQREVKNPEWILWFWAPIVFVMYVLTRFMWALLLENQGVNFGNVVGAAQSITTEHDGITEIDEEKLADRLPVIVENFRCAYSSRSYAAFLAFECSLVAAPLLLLFFVLPLMIGGAYRSWGLDIARAWWERREWQGSPLSPFLDFSDSAHLHHPVVPLIPRITYCDYHFVSLGNSHTLTYRCYLDANWHERTALFTWVMLVFLALINLGNLFFWLEWTFRMRFRAQRRGWVQKKWLNTDGFNDMELALMMRFAESFKMGQLLYFYYIEAHTDRVVASAFCTALFARWLEKRQRRKSATLEASYAVTMSGGSGGETPARRASAAAYAGYNAAAMPLMMAGNGGVPYHQGDTVAPPYGGDTVAPEHSQYQPVPYPHLTPQDKEGAEYHGADQATVHYPTMHHQIPYPHVMDHKGKQYFVVHADPYGPPRLVKCKPEKYAGHLPEEQRRDKRGGLRDFFKRMSTNYGWNIGMEMPPMRPVPTAPYPTPPNAASFSDASTALMRGSRSQSIIHSPRSPPGDAVPPELAMGTPCISALVGRRKARSPNLAAEIGRDSLCQGPEEEERRAERKRKLAEAAEAERMAKEAAEKAPKDKKASRSSSTSSSDDGEEDDGDGIVTERKPKEGGKGIATERTPLMGPEGAEDGEIRETPKRRPEKQQKEKTPPSGAKPNGGTDKPTRNVTPPGRNSNGTNRPTPPGRAGTAGKLQRQEEEEEE